MTVTGLLTSYGLDANVPISIDPVIDLLDPTDLPFQNGFLMGGGRALSRVPADNKKMEWQDDTLLDPISTINEGSAYLAADTTLTVTDGDRFRPGDVIYVEDEALYVSAVAGDDLTVIRGFAGTVAADHADGTELFVIGQALAEGSDAVAAVHKDRDRRHNFTQIFGPRKVSASGTEQVMPKYGLVRGGEMLYQLDKESMEMAKSLERAIIYGVRFDDGTDQRTMGGLMWHITSNVDAAAANLSIDKIEAQVVNMYNAGASPGQAFVFVCNLANKLILNAITDRGGSGSVEIPRMDRGRNEIVQYLDTDAGRIQFLVSRYMRDTDAILYTPDQAALMPLRPWSITPLAKTGDADSVQIVGEYTLRLKRQRHAAKFTGLTQT